MIATKPDRRARLIYRMYASRRPRKDRRKDFSETGYARLLDAAHKQLGGTIIVVWDTLNIRVSRAMAT